MAALTWARAKARARARAGPHPACVRANVHVGAALSIEWHAFWESLESAALFCRKRRFLKGAEHIHYHAF